jgi:hypothetical protein
LEPPLVLQVCDRPVRNAHGFQRAAIGLNKERNMSSTSRLLLMSTLGAGALVASVVSASAGIACIGPICWHATDRYDYPADSRVVVHEDAWKPAPDARVTWREHTGRGYWRDEKWVEW